MPDLSLSALASSDDGRDLDILDPPPSPPPAVHLDPPAPFHRPGVQHTLSSGALRLHDQLVRRVSGGIAGGAEQGKGVVERDYAASGGGAGSSPRSYTASEGRDDDEVSLAGSIHSAPEFTAPPSPVASLPGVRFDSVSVLSGEEEDERRAGGGGGGGTEGDREESQSPVREEEGGRGIGLGVRRDSVESSVNGDASGGRRGERLRRLPSTLWDYLMEEIFAVEVDGEEGIKSERVTNFLTVPKELEKIILFGVFICLDSFLYTFTILPLRALAASFTLLYNLIHNLLLCGRSTPTRRKRHLRLSHKCDLTKAVILAGTLFFLHRITDASKMYHGVRGQETIKLYVLFNVLEDLQDSLFSRQTLGRRTDGSHPHIRPLALFGLNLAYVVAHSLVLFYQLVTLNVAINSYSNALLTLLLSNQFVEIKGSVFKKFEKENLFQLTCADIVERFQLALMLFIIALRNLIELSSASSSSLFSFLPASFKSLASPSLSLSLPALPTLSLLQAIFSPAVVVLVSECFVDWLKHAFITKFNHIRPGVYGRFVDVLCKDLVAGFAGKREAEPFVDQSPSVARRLGFAALPLGCLVVRVISQAFEMLTDDSGVDECAPPAPVLGGIRPLVVHPARAVEEDWTSWGARWAVVGLSVGVVWACLVAVKLLIGINLRAFASHRWSTMLEREDEDRLNDRARPKIGVTAAEAEQDRHTTALLADDVFDAAYRNRKVNLATLTRYDMVKSRLW
ncbi:hypothetical protein JCM10213v2_007901 [Rhodosporidiobolus nylandii]